jgi:hypothetical protein
MKRKYREAAKAKKMLRDATFVSAVDLELDIPDKRIDIGSGDSWTVIHRASSSRQDIQILGEK